MPKSKNIIRRKKKISREQKEILLAFLQKHPRLVKGGVSHDIVALWDELGKLLNACPTGASDKSADEWKRTWGDLKVKVKAKVAAANIEPLTPFNEKIAALLDPASIKEPPKKVYTFREKLDALQDRGSILEHESIQFSPFKEKVDLLASSSIIEQETTQFSPFKDKVDLLAPSSIIQQAAMDLDIGVSPPNEEMAIAKMQAETAKMQAETAKTQAETARMQAETARMLAETQQKIACSLIQMVQNIQTK